MNRQQGTDSDNSIIGVYDSYKFSDGRIVAILKSFDGKLPNETVLEDSAGNKWKIKQYFWTTGSIEAYKKREEEEKQNIFQYLLEGVNLSEKPMKGITLNILKSA